MVRKDVKIGAVVLAILLAVIVVYVLVVPSGNPAAAPAVANADEAFKEQMKHNESRNLDRPRAASNEPATAPPGAAGFAANGPTKKTDPFADSGEKWMMALNTGAVPQTQLKSNKPMAPGAAISNGGFASKPLEGAIAGNTPISIDPSRPFRPTVKTHTVQTGDSIARIAEAVYGSQVYYKEILVANPGVDPKKLKPGMVLKLPDVKEVRGKGGAEDDSPAPALDKTEYRVASGDSMHGIAKKLYGKSEMWEQIYDLNKAKIGNDPAKLKVGMILKLPSPPTQQ